MNKEAIIVLLCIIGMYIVGFFKGYTAFDKYDVNRDGKVTAQDYVLIKNYIMEEE